MTEALYAAYLLLLIINKNPKLSNEIGFTPLWNLVLNSDKALFLNEKFLFLFSDDGMLPILFNCNIIKLNYDHCITCFKFSVE